MELRQAIINVEQGGSADGILQEFMNVLSERCKKHGIDFKSAALIDLPIGWQPGIPEDVAVWNDEWDKFEDEGLLFDKETTVDVQNTTAFAKSESIMFHYEADSLYDGFSPDSLSNAHVKSEKQFGKSKHSRHSSEFGYAHSEDDSGKSPYGSPTHQTSPSQDFSDTFKSSETDVDFHRSFDGHGWGTFDATDDAESVCGFNPSKDSSHDQFDSGGFGLSPIRTGSSPGGMAYKKSSIFADSAPGTPFSKVGNSPSYSEAGGNFFDNSSRFCSFSMSDSQFSPPREAFGKFDSLKSSTGEIFSRFDSISSSTGETPARFDSVNSSRGEAFGRGFSSYDDADPFGSSGPFKVSGETPQKGSDNWNSF